MTDKTARSKDIQMDSGLLSSSNRSVLLAFVVVVIIGGSNAVAVRLSNQELPPFWGAFLRFFSAAAIFWSIVWIRRIEVPRGRGLTGATIYGVLTIGLSYALLYWALTSLPASLSMVVLAITPLLTFFAAVIHRQENFRWLGLLGAVVAFGGLLLAISQQLRGGNLPLLALLALLGGAASLSEGTVLFKTFPRSSPFVVNAIALTSGSAVLLVFSMLAGEPWKLPSTVNTCLANVYLVLVGSIVLFYLYLYVLERWTASATAYSFLLFPISTTLLAAWLLNEPITGRFFIGGLIVMAGVYFGAFSSKN